MSEYQLQIDFAQSQRDRIIERLGLSKRVTRLLKTLDVIGQERGIVDDFGVCLVDVSKQYLAERMQVSKDTAKRAWEEAEKTPYLIVEKSDCMGHNFALQWPIIFAHSPIPGGINRGWQVATRGVATCDGGGSNLRPPNSKKPNVSGGVAQGGSTLLGGEGGLNSSPPGCDGWQLAKARLHQCGISAIKPAIANAMNAGWSPEQIVTLCDQFLAACIDGVFAWSKQLLYKHIEVAYPGSEIAVAPRKEYRELQSRKALAPKPVPAETGTAAPNLETLWGGLLDSLTPDELAELVAEAGPLVRNHFRRSGLTRAIRGPLLMQLAKANSEDLNLKEEMS